MILELHIFGKEMNTGHKAKKIVPVHATDINDAEAKRDAIVRNLRIIDNIRTIAAKLITPKQITA